MDYFLCTSPRSGSNFLASLLSGTGVAGAPGEFLCSVQMERIGRELCGFADIAETRANIDRYYSVVRQQRAKGSWFGIKLHLKMLDRALQSGFDLDRFFPQRFLYLTRGDLVAQAISRVRAAQTGQWTANQEASGAARFDPEQIHLSVQTLVEEQHGWEAFFDAVQVAPLRMTYEALCDDPTVPLTRILRFLDLDPEQVDLEAAIDHAGGRFRRQRDGLNDEWRDGYETWLRERAYDRAAAAVGA